MFNAEKFIVQTVQKFLSITQIEIEIICADDCSSDGSVNAIKDLQKDYKQLKVISLTKNSGAGVARNEGFKHVTGDFVYFFDADDIVHPEVLLDSVHRLENSNAELIMCAYNLGVSQYDRGPMHGLDQEAWQNILGPQNWTLVNTRMIPSLFGTTNYPWNKILRTDYARSINLAFGSTFVHNDILGHWMSLLYAKRLVLNGAEICTHIVPVKGSNLTNIRDQRRLGVFEALRSLDNILANDKKIYASSLFELTRFKVVVLKWARSNLDQSHLSEFDQLAKNAFDSIGVAEFMTLQNGWPSVANDMIKLRFGS